MPKDKNDFEISPELQAKIQGHLDKVPDPDEEDFLDIPQKEEKEDDAKDDVKDGKDVDEDLDEVDYTIDEDVDEDDDKKGKEDEVILPENYYRAAVHSDWTSEEIQGFFKTNPELALKTFKKIYDSTNVATNEFVELGRANQKQLQEAEAAEQAKKDAEVNKFKGMDMDAVAEQFKDEPAVVALLKAADEQNRTFHEQLIELKKTQTQTAAQAGMSDEDTRIWNDINSFFDGKGLDAFGEFYGKSEKDKNWNQVLTGEQMQNRHQVIVMADQISAGAKLAGREMDRGETLRRAHLAASDSVRETVIRNELKEKAKKRSKGITVKSMGRKAQDDTTPEKKSEKTAIKRAGKRLGKLFGGHVE